MDEKELTQEQKEFIEVVNKQVKETVETVQKSTKEAFDAKMAEIEKSIKDKGGDNVEIAKVLKDIEDIKANMAEIFKRKGQNIDMSEKDGIEEIADKILDNENFKKFANGKGGITTGEMKFETKSVVSMENNYTGDILISRQSNVVVTHPQPRKINVRDIISKTTGDPEYTSLTFSKITDIDRNVAMVSENGRLPQASFKAKEETYYAKRIGVHMPISKRMLKSRAYVRSWITNNVPKWIRQSEDFQLLKGDGNGENLLGIMNQCQDFKDILGDYIIGAAGTIKAVETYNSGANTIIEFTDPQPLINNGMNITFSGFANAAYNAKFKVNKINDRKIMIEVAYTAQTDAQALAASFNAGNEFANTVEAPNMVDAIIAGQKYLTYGIYTPNAVMLNPMDVFRILTLKNTLGDKLRTTVTVDAGVTYIGNLPIVETTAVLPNEALMGDFSNAAEIVDYTALNVEFAEDIETKLTNQVVMIAQAELIFPVYNPYAFLKFKIDEIINLLEI
ncbi:phage major capsid protein [Dysgonomonas sp. GY75]|uniref:phage major capsid family protein n=1 Tax=Dysgonomonas sp. GY75 TaxID=2780419 RepID=UPI001883BA7F|nr:phage major capsid protein [Dysgonomonas sp. GY75]MBF0651286.1 phage major capsid protein [Dysgonomonas sp. GY75]